LAREHIEARELDIVRVIGKETPVQIFQLLAKRGEITDTQKTLNEEFTKGISYYRSKQWDSAISTFTQCLSFVPDDTPSQIYIERCRYFKKNLVPENWDGVYSLTKK